MPRQDGTGPQGGGGGQGGGRGAGPVGNCVCPSCGAKAPHVRGEPCVAKDCPKCGAKMVRE